VAFSSAAPCFTAGTRILTIEDEIPVEDLQPGDELVLHGGGSAKIIWIGRRHTRWCAETRPHRLARPCHFSGRTFDPGQGPDQRRHDPAMFAANGGHLFSHRTGRSCRDLCRRHAGRDLSRYRQPRRVRTGRDAGHQPSRTGAGFAHATQLRAVCRAWQSGRDCACANHPPRRHPDHA
ncbi:MAG: hypothetical protein B7X01_04030, partial [Acidiphilium sp. 21-62-4]